MIKIYGSAMSSASRCLFLLEEIGVPYERLDSGLDTPEGRAKYTEMFPGAKVPFLVDGDVKLFESMAINMYLASKYKPELLPTDVHGRALVDQWSYWAITNLQPELLKVMMNTTFLPEDQRKPSEVEAGRKGAARYLEQLEAALTHDYLVGNTFTLADLNCGSVVGLCAFAGLTYGPKTTAWMDRLKARPSYAKTH
jgi:glutathione S-transferase